MRPGLFYLYVRMPDAWRAGHLKGKKNLPASSVVTDAGGVRVQHRDPWLDHYIGKQSHRNGKILIIFW